MSQFADQFAEVKDQLNESAVSANKFNEAISGNDTSKFGKEVKKNADALKDLGLTDTDFRYTFETDGVEKGYWYNEPLDRTKNGTAIFY